MTYLRLTHVVIRVAVFFPRTGAGTSSMEDMDISEPSGWVVLQVNILANTTSFLAYCGFLPTHSLVLDLTGAGLRPPICC